MIKLLDKVVSQQITQNGFGKIMNPYTEQVFNGVGMRQFTFDWKLVPRNSDETAKIKNQLLKNYQIKCPSRLQF